MSKKKTVEYQVQFKSKHIADMWYGLPLLIMSNEDAAASGLKEQQASRPDYELRVVRITTEVLTKGDR